MWAIGQTREEIIDYINILLRQRPIAPVPAAVVGGIMKTFSFIVVLFLLGVGIGSSTQMQAAISTPSPGAMTVYQVSNPNASALLTTHTFINAISTPVYVMNSTVPAVSTAVYHVRDMPQIVSPFNGSVRIEADMPFSAEVVDYDYPPTSTPTPTRTATPTATATPTHVVIILPILK